MSFEIVLREEEKPRFKLWQAVLIALVILFLLAILADRSDLFRLSLDEQRLAELRAERDARQRDLVFRFLDAPAEETENPDARFASDADRQLRSQPVEPEQVDNQDPYSEGNSFDLEQSDPRPYAEPQVAQSQSEPVPADEPKPLEPGDKPEQAAEPDAEVVDAEDAEQAPIFQLEDGPKPYRKPTREEVERANQIAKEQVAKSSAGSPRSTPSDLRRYDNPSGRTAPQIGFSVDTAGHDLGPYLKQLISLVKSNWRVPEIARLEASGVVVVYFELHQDGRIKQTAVVVNSDYEPLDMSSYNAIQAVYQAPPLPSHIKEPWIPLKFAFYYNVRPPY